MSTGEDSGKQELDVQLHEALKSVKVPEDWELLPIDPNYHGEDLRHLRYRGTILTNWHLLAGCVDHWARFQPRDSDVVVASFPKSGTTWLQEIVWRIVHNETDQNSAGTPLEFRFPLLDMPAIGDMQMVSLHDLTSPRLIKTHLTYDLLPGNLTSSNAKVLYVSRDARDVCVSYYHFSRMVQYDSYRGTFQQFRERFQRGEVMHGPYREHVKGYLDHSDTVFCVTYEQLHGDRPEVIRKIAAFLGRSLSEEHVANIVRCTSFETMKKNPETNFRHWEKTGFICKDQKETFMRKGKVGDWRNYFSEEESAAFMKWRNEPM